MHPASKSKKFTHNRMKACLLRNDQEDKENLRYPDQFKNKKFSVELPSKNMDCSEHPKSIFNEQISVTLNTSNGRNHLYDKDIISLDIQTLNHLLSKQNGMSLRDMVKQIDLKSVEVRLLVERMLHCMRNEEGTHGSSMVSEEDEEVEWQLNQTQMKPYIEKEIELLQQNLEKLLVKKEEYVSIQSIGHSNKDQILAELRKMHMKQMQELQMLQ